MEARGLSCNDKSKSVDSTVAGKLSYKRKSVAVEEYAEEGDTVPVELAMKKNSGDTTNETQRDDISSSQLSTGETIHSSCVLDEFDSSLLFLTTIYSTKAQQLHYFVFILHA